MSCPTPPHSGVRHAPLPLLARACAIARPRAALQRASASAVSEECEDLHEGPLGSAASGSHRASHSGIQEATSPANTGAYGPPGHEAARRLDLGFASLAASTASPAVSAAESPINSATQTMLGVHPNSAIVDVWPGDRMNILLEALAEELLDGPGRRLLCCRLRACSDGGWSSCRGAGRRVGLLVAHPRRGVLGVPSTRAALRRLGHAIKLLSDTELEECVSPLCRRASSVAARAFPVGAHPADAALAEATDVDRADVSWTFVSHRRRCHRGTHPSRRFWFLTLRTFDAQMLFCPF